MLEPYNGKNVYVWYDQAGCPSAYIVLQGENYYSVNRMFSVNLHVYEMAYTSPEGLLALFGVMRMFEGEFDSVFLHDIAMLPEVELVLKNYMHTSCRTYSDLALRILDVEAVLKANTYPTEGGRFVLRVEDNLPYVRGVYEVVYAGGGCEVVRKPEGDAFDLSVPVTALSRLLYGTEQFDARLASYMEGVVLQNEASDFFRRFQEN